MKALRPAMLSETERRRRAELRAHVAAVLEDYNRSPAGTACDAEPAPTALEDAPAADRRSLAVRHGRRRSVCVLIAETASPG